MESSAPSDAVLEPAAPTSEVGSAPREPNTNCEENENLGNYERGPVTEKASVPMEVYYENMLRQQNEQINRLIQAMKQPFDGGINTKTNLPVFNPDKGDVDAKAWCNTVALCMEEKPLSGSNLIISLSSALKGSASSWFSQISYSGMDWNHFREIFLSRFDSTETSAAALMRINTSTPIDGESMSSFANRTLTSLMARWKTLSLEEIAVSIVLARCVQIDPRIQRLAYTTDLKDRTSMQRELMAFAQRKRPNNDRGPTPADQAKRMKTVTCYTCGQVGHKSNECRQRSSKIKTFKTASNKTNQKSGDEGQRRSVVCFKCGQVGHIAPQCAGRRASSSNSPGTSDKSSVAERRRVDACSVKPVSSQLTHLGQSFYFCFDSGAECSLIKETLANKFGGKRFGSLVTLLGIGKVDVYSTCQILSEVCINNNVIEILFHVVPDDAISYGIMIGRDLITQGFTVEISNDKLDIKKSQVINLCEVGKPICDFKNVDTDVTGEHHANLVNILKKHHTSFVVGTPTGRANTGEIEIKLIDPNRTVQRRPYRMSPDESQVCRKKIEELLEANIIRPSCSPFASPILLVKKKDGSDRLCVDYRELNRNTVPDRFPLPLISDQIQRLKGANYFTILDAASGFHQIPIHKDSIERTAFVTPDGQYEYLTMPFGLRNAPSVFQRAMYKALGNLVNTFVVCYLDDVMIVSETEEEGLERLNVVLETLQRAGISLNLKKCSFLKTRVEYLGYEVTSGQIRPNPRKFIALTKLPPPQTVTQVRQFIGLASYFRQFIPKFSQLAAPLYKLTLGKGKVEWKSKHEDIRQKIIAHLTNEPVLMIFDPNYPIELHTDASADGYGAILLQKKDCKSHVVAYYSKKTTNAESRYHSYELETLALVNGIKHFRHFLQGRQFTVITDCNSLRASRTKADLTPRVHRWWAFLQSFDFDILYRDGKRMGHVDFLSRNPLPSEDVKQKVVEKHVNLLEISKNWLHAEQQGDPEIIEIISKLNNNEITEDLSNTYQIISGVLHRKIQRNGRTRSLPIVPRAFRWSVINHVHESIMHLGWEKTLEKAFDFYWFSNMRKYVRKFVENCMTCKLSKSKSGKAQAELHPIPKVAVPWHTVHIDATGKLSGKHSSKEYIFVLIDAFTKYILLRHASHIDATSAINALKSGVSLFGAPVRVIADQGRCFANKHFREFCDANNIQLHLISTGTSRANGQVERVMSTLKSMLTAVEVNKERTWQDAVDDVQLAFNCTVNRVTKASPIELLIGKVARPMSLCVLGDQDQDEIDIVKIREQAVNSMNENSRRDKERFDSNKAKISKFAVGDFVLIENHERNQTKLDPKFRGPFKVIEVLDGDRYLLKAIDTNRTYKYAHERLRPMPNCYVPTELELCCNADDNEDQSGSALVGEV